MAGKRSALLSDITTIIAFVAMGAVAVVLLAGLGNMTRGGSPNVSQNLMRWRVILQFVAVVVLMAIVYVKSNSTG
jgi:hypothetical protein